MFFKGFGFCVDIICVCFHNPTYIIPMFNGQMDTFISFADGVNRCTFNLASEA